MIGRAEWFTRRKYTGWGVTPKTWQGWIYVFAMVVPFVLFQSLPFWSVEVRTYATIFWLLIIGLDLLDIMYNLKKDEREELHEAISERNAAWGMIIILSLGLVYQVISSALEQKLLFDPIILITLLAGVFIKAASNIYLERHN